MTLLGLLLSHCSRSGGLQVGHILTGDIRCFTFEVSLLSLHIPFYLHSIAYCNGFLCKQTTCNCLDIFNTVQSASLFVL